MCSDPETYQRRADGGVRPFAVTDRRPRADGGDQLTCTFLTQARNGARGECAASHAQWMNGENPIVGSWVPVRTSRFHT
jgi:hypothetical protein